MSLTVYSQTATDSIVVLPKWVAIEVVKDLDRLDMCDSLLKLTEAKMENMAKELGLQDRIIIGQQTQLEQLNQVIANHQEKFNVSKEETKYWEKQYKKQKRQKFTVAGIALAVIVLLVVN